MKRVSAAWVALAICVACGIGAPAAAFAATVHGRMVDPYPRQQSTAVVYATVRDIHGDVVPNTKVSLLWRADGHVTELTTRTNSKGVVSSRFRLGRVTPWRTDRVRIRADVRGHTFSASVNFWPIPVVSAAHPATVRIGVVGPTTEGDVSVGRGMQRAAVLAIEQYNVSAAVRALRLRFVPVLADDRDDPAAAVKAASQLTADPRLLGVFGHAAERTCEAAAPVYVAKTLRAITPACVDPAFPLRGLSMDRICPNAASQTAAAADFAHRLGYTKAFVVEEPVDASRRLGYDFSASFVASDGATIDSLEATHGAADFGAILGEVQAWSPDVIFYAGSGANGASFSRQAHEAGVTAPVLGVDSMFDPRYIALGGSAETSGDLCTGIGYPVDHLPDGAGFVDAFGKRYPGRAIGPSDPYAYDATDVILSAIVAEAQSRGTANVGVPVAKQEIRSRIDQTRADGVTGAISFGIDGDRTQQDIAYYEVLGGQWVFQGMW